MCSYHDEFTPTYLMLIRITGCYLFFVFGQLNFGRAASTPKYYCISVMCFQVVTEVWAITILHESRRACAHSCSHNLNWRPFPNSDINHSMPAMMSPTLWQWTASMIIIILNSDTDHHLKWWPFPSPYINACNYKESNTVTVDSLKCMW